MEFVFSHPNNFGPAPPWCSKVSDWKHKLEIVNCLDQWTASPRGAASPAQHRLKGCTFCPPTLPQVLLILHVWRIYDCTPQESHWKTFPTSKANFQLIWRFTFISSFLFLVSVQRYASEAAGRALPSPRVLLTQGQVKLLVLTFGTLSADTYPSSRSHDLQCCWKNCCLCAL